MVMIFKNKCKKKKKKTPKKWKSIGSETALSPWKVQRDILVYSIKYIYNHVKYADTYTIMQCNRDYKIAAIWSNCNETVDMFDIIFVEYISHI